MLACLFFRFLYCTTTCIVAAGGKMKNKLHGKKIDKWKGKREKIA